MIKAVIFDLDNTLIDFMGAKITSCEASIDAMIAAGLKLNKKKAMNILFALYKQYGIEYKPIFQKFLLKTIGRIDVKILAAGIVAYRRIQASYHRPYDGVFSVLKKLKKKRYKLAIVTDAPVLKAWLRLTEMGIQDYFDVVVTFNDTRKLKPNELPFRAALKKLSIHPEEILFVGDQPHRDIKGAKSLGMNTALAMYGIQKDFRKYIRENKPDYTLDSVTDILKVVNQSR